MKKLKMGVMILGCAVLAIAGNAATNDVSGLLQKGLFEEEANRNLEAAIQAYQGVIAQTDKDRKFGATAIFRLGECYRKLGKTNEANEQYARIVKEFPEQTELVKLSQQHGGASRVIGAGNTQQEAIGGWELASVMQAEALSRQLTALKDLPTDKRRILVQQQYGNPVIDALMQKLTDAEEQLAVQSASKGDQHPDVVRARLTIEKLQKQIDQQVDGVILGLELKTKAAQETVKMMEERNKQQAATTTKSRNDAAAVKPVTTGSGEDEQIRRIRAMIQNSPDLINATDNDGYTPLERTASLGQLTVAKFLLENKASLQVAQGRKSPLHQAADNGHKAMVELLLNSGADVNVRDNSGQTPLHLAASKGFVSVTELLVSRGADINAKDGEKMTPLHRAVSKGKSAVVEFLIGEKAEVNTRSERGETPLMTAVISRQPQILAILLKHGADINAQLKGAPGYQYDDWTALHFAVKLNQTEMVRLLLEHGARPDILVNYDPDNSNRAIKAAPLHMAANQRQREIGELLLKSKSDVDIRDGKGRTPLHYSVERGDKGFCEMLLGHKADVNARNEEGQSPLLVAIRMSNPAVTELLLRNGADPNTKDEKGLPVLFSAVHPSRLDGAQLLIQNGADVNAQDQVGNKPLDWVRMQNSSDSVWFAKITKLLRDKGGMSTAEFSTIRVTRAGLDAQVEFFRKDKEGLNRYTLYELLSKVYLNNETQFPFPDLNRVSIKRRIDERGKTENIEVKLKDMLDTGDCTKDMWLKWGDVVDIPEADHNINERWDGLPRKTAESLELCQIRRVTIIVKGQTNEVILIPPWNRQRLRSSEFITKLEQMRSRAISGVSAPVAGQQQAKILDLFRLNQVIRDAGVLLASSDLSRVKVSRLDPVTKQVQEKVFDLSQASGRGMPGGLSYSWTAPSTSIPARTLRQPGAAAAVSVPSAEPYNAETDLWLRDGDVIEIPEKP